MPYAPAVRWSHAPIIPESKLNVVITSYRPSTHGFFCGRVAEPIVEYCVILLARHEQDAASSLGFQLHFGTLICFFQNACEVLVIRLQSAGRFELVEPRLRLVTKSFQG